MKFQRSAIFWLSLAAAGVPLQPGYGQGSLTPPGPPGPTMKSLAQIEPRTPISSVPFSITVPGSYYFTTNLSGVLATNGITIQTDDVSLDLNGFSLVGNRESLAGILVAGARRNIAIRNGTVRNWTAGIAAETSTHCRFESLHVSSNGGAGISVGANSTVVGCAAYSNDGNGITADRESIVRDCIARDNIQHGIQVGFGSQVWGCTASLNSEHGMVLDRNCRVANSSAFNNSRTGISGREDCQISHSSTANNKESGIGMGANSVVNNCSSTSNLSSGIVAGDGGKVTASAASYNGQIGILVGTGATVDQSTASFNKDHGIVAGSDSHLMNSQASKNQKMGIRADSGSNVRACTTQRNGGDGIVVSSECTVASNNCHGNFNARDASGIHVTGTDNCIKENNVTSNDRGVTVDVSGNIVFKNTAANNTINYFIVGPQSLAPIFKDKAPLEVTNPWTNFEF